MTKQQRIVMMRRRRIFKLIAIVCVLAITICLITSFISRKNKVSGVDVSDTYIEYVVHSGDTLWEIAKNYTSNHYDVRVTIREIRELNGLEDAMIYSGDMLLIPTKYCEE